MGIFIIFCSCTAIRYFIYMHFYLTLSKRERKDYKNNESIAKRWFFVNVWSYTKDTYSKSEKKTVKYVFISRLYFFVNLLCHLVLIGYTALVFAAKAGAFSLPVDKLSFYAMSFYLIIFVLFAVIEYYERPTYHRNRERYRRKQ